RPMQASVSHLAAQGLTAPRPERSAARGTATLNADATQRGHVTHRLCGKSPDPRRRPAPEQPVEPSGQVATQRGADHDLVRRLLAARPSTRMSSLPHHRLLSPDACKERSDEANKILAELRREHQDSIRPSMRMI
ncbi:unnamed protein product, partial [Durusdinium trenchii]